MSAGRPLLAFRPVAAVHRLPPRSQACPLSLRDVLRALGKRRPLPIFRAPLPAVARAVLLAARQAGSAVGLALGPGLRPEPWFDAVAEAADEIAPRLPLFLAGEVEVGPGEAGLERAAARVHRLVEAGLTHVALDVSAVPAADRARAAARVAAFPLERELAVEYRCPGEEPAPEEVVRFLEELQGWDLAPDAVGVRCRSPEGIEGAKAQARWLVAVTRALGGTPLVRRGPATPLLHRACRVAGPTAVEDGGRALEAGIGGLAPEARREAAARLESGAAPALGDGEVARVEGLAFAEAASLIEALGAEGTAAAVEAGLT